MGNYMSCNVISPTMKSYKAARVILPGGEIKQFREPIKAAEIMLESPNYFVVNAKSLRNGRRFSAMAADEDLEFGNLYIMFPMKRVRSVITAADMAVILMSANSAAKRISGGGNTRDSTAVAATVATSTVATMTATGNGDRIGEMRLDSEVFDGLEMKYRSTICRSRKPLLDTILEEPIF